jgi:hypothetical protein
MSENAKQTAHKVIAFLVSVVFFFVSVALLVLNARAMSLIVHSMGNIQSVTISNVGTQIQLRLDPENLVKTGIRAMLVAGAGGSICGFLSMLLSLRPVSFVCVLKQPPSASYANSYLSKYVYAHAWIAIFAIILAIAGFLSEYISFYKSSTLVLSAVGTTDTNGYAKGWYSVGSWFCQTKTVFANPVGANFNRACTEDIATRVLIVVYLAISIGLFVIAVKMRREERKIVQLKIEPKRYNGGEMHNIPL